MAFVPRPRGPIRGVSSPRGYAPAAQVRGLYAQPQLLHAASAYQPVYQPAPFQPIRRALQPPTYRVPYQQPTMPLQQPPQPLRQPVVQRLPQTLSGKGSALGKGRGKGGKGAAIKEAVAAKAAATGATAEDALDCLLAVLPLKGGVALPQVGSLISNQRPGGWVQNFSHLGSLSKFIEANPYYLQIEQCEPQPIVSRCDPEALAAPDQGPQVAAPKVEGPPVVPLTEEEAISTIHSLIPPGQIMQVSQLGSTLGGGGWSANKQFSHLAKNLQTFLLDHPEWFAVDIPTLTVQHASNVPDGAAVAAAASQAAARKKPDGPKATTADAAAALLTVLPEGAPLPLAQLGTQLGVGGWKLTYGHLGTLRSFLENNPDLFIVDSTAIATGGQPLIFRGPKTLEEVAEVQPGQSTKRIADAAIREMPPAKRVAVAGAVTVLPRRVVQ